MAFITEDFLLQSETAKYLYRNYAARQPIIDYHCHLSAQDIAANRRFQNLFEIWLEGDHYKWRAMRFNGVPERYCTGPADPYEKFLAWARTVPSTLRNPLYHWTHLELLRYFQIDESLDEGTAPGIWEYANERLMDDDLFAQGIVSRFGVTALCTSDDPTDSLESHIEIQASGLPFGVFPTFRPDRALRTWNPPVFNQWVANLSQRAEIPIKNFGDFLDALKKRHDDFHACGCRLSDHGIDHCYAESCTEAEAAKIFDHVRRGDAPAAIEAARFASYLLLFFGRLDAEKGWTKQLHLGALRNANPAMLAQLGRDTGFDSIGDWQQVESLAGYLSQLERDNALPKTIIYNANPAQNYAFATMIGNFQDGTVAGKVQLGAAWWFLDHKDGITWQLNALSNCGLLARFIGMVTDSRSFMSYPRHEYFRRVLCNILGSEVEAGQLPNDETLLGRLISGICYHNAVGYLGLPTVEASPRPVVTSFEARAAQHSADGRRGTGRNGA
jgi:glucuronate isomerase